MNSIIAFFQRFLLFYFFIEHLLNFYRTFIEHLFIFIEPSKWLLLYFYFDDTKRLYTGTFMDFVPQKLPEMYLLGF